MFNYENNYVKIYNSKCPTSQMTLTKSLTSSHSLIEDIDVNLVFFRFIETLHLSGASGREIEQLGLGGNQTWDQTRETITISAGGFLH